MEDFTNRTIIHPDAVDSFLGNALNQLSFQQRNDIQEEIHGVKTGEIEETPELIETGLHQIVEELLMLPPSEKKAYVHALELAQQHQQQEYNLETSYIDKPDFYLRFLRTERWNARKAAKRLVMFLDLLLDLYGEYALQRPIRISDFTDDELKDINCGEIQLLPFRDRSGRRVIATVSNCGLDMGQRGKVRVSPSCGRRWPSCLVLIPGKLLWLTYKFSQIKICFCRINGLYTWDGSQRRT
jgi:hypothetical protein